MSDLLWTGAVPTALAGLPEGLRNRRRLLRHPEKNQTEHPGAGDASAALDAGRAPGRFASFDDARQLVAAPGSGHGFRRWGS
jgi:hypothetical protein